MSGFATGTVPWLLVLFGVGLFVGNLAGGRAADVSLSRTLVTVLAVLTVVLVGFALTAASPALAVASLVLMGAFGFATVPPLQMRIMKYAHQAPTLASGANIAAFNLGNALGAWVGGLTISAGLGFTGADLGRRRPHPGRPGGAPRRRTARRTGAGPPVDPPRPGRRRGLTPTPSGPRITPEQRTVASRRRGGHCFHVRARSHRSAAGWAPADGYARPETGGGARRPGPRRENRDTVANGPCQ